MSIWDTVKRVYYYPRKLKREAIGTWGEVASREFDRGEAARKAGGPDASLKHFLYKSNSLAYYGAQAAAAQAAETVPGVALDVLSMFRGSITSRLALGILRAGGTRAAKAQPLVRRGIEGAEKLAKGWATPTSRVFKARKAIKLASVASRNTQFREPQNGGRPPDREPFAPISSLIKPEFSRPIRSTPGLKHRSPGGLSYSLLDPVKLADWSLRHTRATQPAAAARAGTSAATQRWLSGVQKQLGRGSLARSIEAHRGMEQRYGVDPLANQTHFDTRMTATMSASDVQRLHQQFGVHTARARPIQHPSQDQLWLAARQLR